MIFRFDKPEMQGLCGITFRKATGCTLVPRGGGCESASKEIEQSTSRIKASSPVGKASLTQFEFVFLVPVSSAGQPR
jgi:hypothetical protein